MLVCHESLLSPGVNVNQVSIWSSLNIFVHLWVLPVSNLLNLYVNLFAIFFHSPLIYAQSLGNSLLNHSLHCPTLISLSHSLSCKIPPLDCHYQHTESCIPCLHIIYGCLCIVFYISWYFVPKLSLLYCRQFLLFMQVSSCRIHYNCYPSRVYSFFVSIRVSSLSPFAC